MESVRLQRCPNKMAGPPTSERSRLLHRISFQRMESEGCFHSHGPDSYLHMFDRNGLNIAQRVKLPSDQCVSVCLNKLAQTNKCAAKNMFRIQMGRTRNQNRNCWIWTRCSLLAEGTPVVSTRYAIPYVLARDSGQLARVLVFCLCYFVTEKRTGFRVDTHILVKEFGRKQGKIESSQKGCISQKWQPRLEGCLLEKVNILCLKVNIERV